MPYLVTGKLMFFITSEERLYERKKQEYEYMHDRVRNDISRKKTDGQRKGRESEPALRPAPSGSVRLRQAPSDSVRPRREAGGRDAASGTRARQPRLRAGNRPGFF